MTVSMSGGEIYCAGSSLAGYSDWRLPNIKELKTIFNYGKGSFDETFVNTGNTYWSSTTSAVTAGFAWTMSYSNGGVRSSNGSIDYNHIRCVRGGSKSDIWLSDFSDISIDATSDGAISHGSTGLIWQKKDDDTTRTWVESLAYCEDSTSDSYDDWRLPNLSELQSIVDYDVYNPAIDKDYFPETKDEVYWSSTTYEYNENRSWSVRFGQGHVGYYLKSENYYVRCVRGGK